MLSTMQDFPLTINMIFEHGRSIYGDSRVITFAGEESRSASYAEVVSRVERLAAALRRLGIGDSDRVGTFMWNNQEHLEAYLAVPCMGAVLHTLNLRLFPEQLAYVINHAEDRVILVDGSIIPLLARVIDQLQTVEHLIVVGAGDTAPLTVDGSRARVHHYDELLAAEEEGFAWPAVDERSAAAMCYTSGTTGNPKGVVYSHRSSVLHSFGIASGTVFGLTEHDSILPIVPMFHAAAWGLPYVGWMAGADFVMPDRFLQAEPLCKMIAQHRPTISGAVPTIWNDVLLHAEGKGVDFSSIRLVVCGGSAVPRSLMEAFQQRHQVTIVQGWGMTETSPLGAVARPPRGTASDREMDWRAKTGRIVPGIQLRLVSDDGTVQPWDGEAVGEIQVRGPWVTGSYYKDDDPQKFDDGWLCTGDVGTVDEKGFIQITDRAKDVIKSGGEWISSVDLENELMGHPEVVEAAVIGVPDERWQERPVACVVRKEGSAVSGAELREYLGDKVAKWWLPERWTFIDEVPKTSVGKFDKKVLRARYADGNLEVEELEGKARAS
jgi:fatty-acyl-CoA synthase